MRIRVLACLPRVAAPSDGIDLAGSRIVQLPFDEWLALEGQRQSGVYDKLRSKYTARPPAFWEGPLDVDPQLTTPERAHTAALARLAGTDLDVLVAALHWYTGTAPIHPRRSVLYFDAGQTEDGVPRMYGESEKEYATENDRPAIVLRACDAGPLGAMLVFARETTARWRDGSYQHPVQSLSLSSTPGLGWSTRLLLLVGAFEALLLEDLKRDLLQAFAERFAALVTEDPAERTAWTSWGRLGYELRSDLVHARSIDATVGKLPAPPEEFVARLERAGVVALCRLLGGSGVVHQWQVDPAGC